MELNLKKPLIFFDLETTGVNVTKDRIVELSYIKIYPNGKEEERTIRLNPEMPIPPQATAVHHITDEDVKDKPTFKTIAKDLDQCSRARTSQDSTAINSMCRCFLRNFIEQVCSLMCQKKNG